MKNINLAMPTHLNFGTHEIQTLKDERWLATKTGNQSEAPTAGTIALVDTTAGEKKWEVKVKQLSQWGNQAATLGEPVLKIYGGELTYTGFDPKHIGYYFSTVGKTLDLTATNGEHQILELAETNLRGQIEFKLEQFELFVPKNYPKSQGVYQAEFVWTASNSP